MGIFNEYYGRPQERGGGASTFRKLVATSLPTAFTSNGQTRALSLSALDGYRFGDTHDDFDIIGIGLTHGGSPNFSISRWVDIARYLPSTGDSILITPNDDQDEDYSLTRTSSTVVTVRDERASGTGSNPIGYLHLTKF